MERRNRPNPTGNGDEHWQCVMGLAVRVLWQLESIDIFRTPRSHNTLALAKSFILQDEASNLNMDPSTAEDGRTLGTAAARLGEAGHQTRSHHQVRSRYLQSLALAPGSITIGG